MEMTPWSSIFPMSFRPPIKRFRILCRFSWSIPIGFTRHPTSPSSPPGTTTPLQDLPPHDQHLRDPGGIHHPLSFFGGPAFSCNQQKDVVWLKARAEYGQSHLYILSIQYITCMIYFDRSSYIVMSEDSDWTRVITVDMQHVYSWNQLLLFWLINLTAGDECLHHHLAAPTLRPNSKSSDQELLLLPHGSPASDVGDFWCEQVWTSHFAFWDTRHWPLNHVLLALLGLGTGRFPNNCIWQPELCHQNPPTRWFKVTFLSP